MIRDDEWTSPKPSKRQKNTACDIHCTDSCDKLVKPQSLESWKSLVNAAVLHQHSALLDIAGKLGDDEIGDVCYHRRCREKFTLKKKTIDILKKGPS